MLTRLNTILSVLYHSYILYFVYILLWHPCYRYFCRNTVRHQLQWLSSWLGPPNSHSVGAMSITKNGAQQYLCHTLFQNEVEIQGICWCGWYYILIHIVKKGNQELVNSSQKVYCRLVCWYDNGGLKAVYYSNSGISISIIKSSFPLHSFHTQIHIALPHNLFKSLGHDLLLLLMQNTPNNNCRTTI